MIDTAPQDGRWSRILRHPLVLLIGGFTAFVVLYAVGQIAAASIKPIRNTPLQPIVALIAAGLGLWLYKVMRRRFERSEHDELALAGAGRELSVGLLGGVALFAGVVAVVAALGGFGIDGLRGIGRLWAMLAMAVLSGVFEEVIFRGIVFRHVESLAGSWAALAVTSLFFGAVHLGNPGATWFAALAIASEAGILLGAAYMLTRRLWLAIGLHAGWNFAQGWIFSAPVSGGKAPDGLLITHRAGPEWLTGGAFGLEASAVAMGLVTAVGLALLALAIRQGRYQPVPWLARRRAVT